MFRTLAGLNWGRHVLGGGDDTYLLRVEEGDILVRDRGYRPTYLLLGKGEKMYS